MRVVRIKALAWQYLASIALACSQPCLAADHVWVIGGGPDVYGSGVHIEYNVNWVLDFLRSAPSARKLYIYFGAGTSNEKDIVEWSPPAEGKTQMLPLARVYDELPYNGESYRKNRVADITGTTSREKLVQSLKIDFARLKPGDRAFIVYNGHGLRDADDAGNNTLRLWDNSSLSAREFESLLSEIERSVPTRFLFAQCYSGGFSRLVHPRGDDVLELADGNRCGFLAASEREESEGCSSSTKVGDYRDYTTQFFAVFSGKTRQGESIDGNLDLDGDGNITMYDAHLFALTRGYSRSMPRSTSETFLEHWQPWYRRWIDTQSEPDNLYGRLAQDVAKTLRLPKHGSELVAELRQRRHRLQEQLAKLSAEHDENEQLIRPLQDKLQQVMRAKWPEVQYPYTSNFLRFLTTNLDEAQTFITKQPDYSRLAALQDRKIIIEASILGLERDIVDLDKVRRLRKLARLREQFDAHANSRNQKSYQQLLACERSAL